MGEEMRYAVRTAYLKVTIKKNCIAMGVGLRFDAMVETDL